MRKKFSWRKIAIKFFTIGVSLLLLLYGALYFFQEKLLFRPEVLSPDYAFTFEGDFEEVYIPVEADVKLHGLLFKADKPKGLVFYLHGNGGSLNGWGRLADTFTNADYDIFMLDYRGYGKSGGSIESEEQLHKDVEAAYKIIKQNYNEENIIIAGYSIGTGFATHLAERKNIKALILQAPYSSMSALITEKAPFVPGFITR